MDKQRLEIFSDAVIAIAMTIMVLELKPPEGTDFAALRPLAPIVLAYILSYFYLAVYWSNHHHMLHLTSHVDGRIMWANLHLLFWLSLIPFSTAWMSEHMMEPLPTAFYGLVLLMGAIAYFFLQSAIIAHGGDNTALRKAVGSDIKGKGSIVAYAVALPVAFLSPATSFAVYVFMALLWLVPDPRIEKATEHKH